eukprot:GHVH01005506.1.p1 GENE.GHVH01005506.1~~GHVH01005506.1.p1  ORF type:complete len:137 (+),score=17.87 GHVH01005506.1:42-452(+)
MGLSDAVPRVADPNTLSETYLGGTDDELERLVSKWCQPGAWAKFTSESGSEKIDESPLTAEEAESNYRLLNGLLMDDSIPSGFKIRLDDCMQLCTSEMKRIVGLLNGEDTKDLFPETEEEMACIAKLKMKDGHKTC